MFKNIFPDKLNRLVYKKGPAENPFIKHKEAPKENRAFEDRAKRTPKKQADAVKEKAAKILDKQGAPAKANKWIENILKATGTRVRHEKISKYASQKLVSGVATEISKFMAGKTEVHLPAKNGNTLLIKKVRGGIVAVAFEAQGNARYPKPAEHLIIGNVASSNRVAANMVSKYLDSGLNKKQEKVARAKGPSRSPLPTNDPRANRKSEHDRFMEGATG